MVPESFASSFSGYIGLNNGNGRLWTVYGLVIVEFLGNRADNKYLDFICSDLKIFAIKEFKHSKFRNRFA